MRLTCNNQSEMLGATLFRHGGTHLRTHSLSNISAKGKGGMQASSRILFSAQLVVQTPLSQVTGSIGFVPLLHTPQMNNYKHMTYICHKGRLAVFKYCLILHFMMWMAKVHRASRLWICGSHIRSRWNSYEREAVQESFLADNGEIDDKHPVWLFFQNVMSQLDVGFRCNPVRKQLCVCVCVWARMSFSFVCVSLFSSKFGRVFVNMVLFSSFF